MVKHAEGHIIQQMEHHNNDINKKENGGRPACPGEPIPYLQIYNMCSETKNDDYFNRERELQTNKGTRIKEQ